MKVIRQHERNGQENYRRGPAVRHFANAREGAVRRRTMRTAERIERDTDITLTEQQVRSFASVVGQDSDGTVQARLTVLVALAARRDVSQDACELSDYVYRRYGVEILPGEVLLLADVLTEDTDGGHWASLTDVAAFARLCEFTL